MAKLKKIDFIRKQLADCAKNNIPVDVKVVQRAAQDAYWAAGGDRSEIIHLSAVYAESDRVEKDEAIKPVRFTMKEVLDHLKKIEGKKPSQVIDTMEVIFKEPRLSKEISKFMELDALCVSLKENIPLIEQYPVEV